MINIRQVFKKYAALSSTLAVAAVGILVFAPFAHAGVAGSAGPTYPSTVSVGDSNIPVSIQITNNSTAPQDTETVLVTNIFHTPSCGSDANPICAAGDADPGVFQITGAVTGRTGTACAGTTFTVGTPDATTGEVQFTPSAAVVLGTSLAGGDAAKCIIDFHVNVLKTPTKDSNSIASGMQTAQLARAHFLSQTSDTNGSASGSSEVTVNKVSPTISTVPNPATTTIGSLLNDTATLSGGSSPGGAVTFNLFAPSDSTCTGTPAYTNTDPSAPYATSPGFTANEAGTWHWMAVYAGDANNNGATSTCASEAVVVGKIPSSVVTEVRNGQNQNITSTTTPAGTLVHDHATVNGNGTTTPTGTVDFALFNNGSCTGTPASTQTGVALVAGAADSSSFTPTSGSYGYMVTYSGDSNYSGSSGVCEPFTIAQLTPTVTTAIHNTSHQTITTANAGDTVHDSANVSGSGSTPTGTVVFSFYSNSNCDGGLLATSSALSLASGSVDATGFAQGPLASGSYAFRAHYNGDAVYTPGNSACEPLAVSKQNSSTVTQVHNASHTDITGQTVTAGTAVHDQAIVAASTTPTGNVTFTLSNNANCDGGIIDTQVVALNGSGVAETSATSTLPAGSYGFKATYAGDSNLNGSTGVCEPFTVSQNHPTIATTLSATSTPVGSSVHDSSALTGATAAAGGTVTYSVFSNNTCSAGMQNAGTKTVTNGIVPDSDPITFNTPGDFYWQAVYSGDTANTAATSTCANEHLVVVGHPSTIVGISSSATSTTASSTVVLTVTEQNDGDVALTSPSVVVTNGSTTLYTLVAPPTSGDTNSNGILDPGETWSWTVNNVSINTTTTFVATGHGMDPSQTDITYPLDQQERASITVNLLFVQGCSPGYWKQPQHFGSYPTNLGVYPDTLFVTVFGVDAFPGKSLLQVLSTGGGGLTAMGRIMVGAYLNSATINGFPYTPSQVIADFVSAYNSKNYGAMQSKYEALQDPCPLGLNPGPSSPSTSTSTPGTNVGPGKSGSAGDNDKNDDKGNGNNENGNSVSQGNHGKSATAPNNGQGVLSSLGKALAIAFGLRKN